MFDSEEFIELSGHQLLLVEDNAMNQLAVGALLEDVGIVVSVANNGFEALDLLEQQAFSWVLMDIQMPEMDGLTASRKIRQKRCFSALPIIAMTANDMDGEQALSLQSGMNMHIVKPLIGYELYPILLGYLDFDNGTQLQEASRQEVVSSREGGNHWLNTLESINAKLGLEYSLNQEPLYLSLLKCFRSENLSTVRLIQQMADRGDVEQLQQITHTLKAQAQSIGAQDLSESASRLNRALRQNQDHKQLLKQTVEALLIVTGTLAQLPEN